MCVCVCVCARACVYVCVWNDLKNARSFIPTKYKIQCTGKYFFFIISMKEFFLFNRKLHLVELLWEDNTSMHSHEIFHDISRMPAFSIYFASGQKLASNGSQKSELWFIQLGHKLNIFSRPSTLVLWKITTFWENSMLYVADGNGKLHHISNIAQ